MRAHFAAAALQLLGYAGSSIAQQVVGYPTNMTFPGLSPTCATALNNTQVRCSGNLYGISFSYVNPNVNTLSTLCAPSCNASLTAARTTIAAACLSKRDVVTVDGNTYPATYFIDSFIQTWKTTCFKDGTGQLCEALFDSWNDPTTQQTFDPSVYCSDCWLGMLALQLSSPLTYNDGLASNFRNLTSSCSATQYAVTSPAPYTVSAPTAAPATTTAAPATPKICSGTYTVQAGDTCNSIALAKNVSTYFLTVQNNIDIWCNTLTTGSQLCLPSTCETYTLGPHDTCDSLIASNPSMTSAQFYSWNPFINDLCVNLNNYIGWEVCLSAPGAKGQLSVVSGALGGSASYSTTASAPKVAASGSNLRCGSWYTVVAGDTCAGVSLANGITLSDFYLLNPEIKVPDCTNLLLGSAYCVAPVGSITSYPGYTATTAPITLSSQSYPPVQIPTAPSTLPASAVPTIPAAMPLASGSLANCPDVHNQQADYSTSCKIIATSYGISVKDLVSWNPSLSLPISTCKLTAGLSYCALNSTDYVPQLRK